MMFGPDWTHTMTGAMTAWHLIVFAVFAILVLYPAGRILQRLGFSPVWAVLALIPFVNLIGLWVVAIVPWPRDVAGTTRDMAAPSPV
jgi:hypothetical protein